MKSNEKQMHSMKILLYNHYNNKVFPLVFCFWYLPKIKFNENVWIFIMFFETKDYRHSDKQIMFGFIIFDMTIFAHCKYFLSYWDCFWLLFILFSYKMVHLTNEYDD